MFPFGLPGIVSDNPVGGKTRSEIRLAGDADSVRL
jgi:hypothetical protein